MSKSIELSNLIKEEKEENEEDNLVDENTKLEIKKIDKPDEVNPESLKNCIFSWVIFLIIAIILSIVAVNYILIQNKITPNKVIPGKDQTKLNNNDIINNNNNLKYNKPE